MREAWQETNDGVYGMHTWIAARLAKIGGGQPTNNSVKEFLDKVDNDDEWFPGKQYGEKRGRKRVLTGPKAVAIERCAKAHKAKGGDRPLALGRPQCLAAALDGASVRFSQRAGSGPNSDLLGKDVILDGGRARRLLG